MKQRVIEFNGGTLKLIAREYRSGRSSEYFTAPRLYVHVEDETIMDNMVNRKRRPYNIYKTLIHASGLGSIISLGTLKWSQKAGCSMCPCSPGFIVDPQGIAFADGETRWWDAWVTLTGAPSIDSSKPARGLVSIL